MDRFFQSLRPFIRGVVRHAAWVLLAAFVLSAASLYFARHLRIDTDFAKLLPDDYPSVEAVNRLRQTVGSEVTVELGIQSPSFADNKRFAEDFIPRALALRQAGGEPYFTGVDYRRDADFLKDNALYFATPAELDTLGAFLSDQIEQAKLEANPFYIDIEDDAAPDTTAQQLQDVYDRLTVDEYAISADSTALVVTFYPSGSRSDLGFISNLERDVGRLIDQMNPASYNAQMQTAIGGRLIRQKIEIGLITGDVFSSFGIGVAAVLLLVVLYFLYKGYRARRAGTGFSGRALAAEVARMPVLGLLIALPLLMSLAWTGGVAYLAFGTLNLMTSTLGLVLFGLGIDFGIHYYARYTEERAEGASVAAAAEHTFVSTGQAITVGALSTAAGLYVLTLADFRGFSEFGFIAGTGILFALVAMTVVLPALVVVFERVRLLDLGRRAARTEAAAAATRYPAARPLVAGSLVAVAVALVLLPRLGFQYDFGALDPRLEPWIQRNAIASQVHANEQSEERRNPAYILTDSPDEVPAVVQAVQQKIDRDTTSPTIDRVESLQERFPLDTAAQQAKLRRVAEIRDLLGSKYLRADSSADLQKVRRAAQTRAPIPQADVPHFLTERFTSKSGAVGNFVIVYPSVGLSDGRQSMAFAEDVGEIDAGGKAYYAASSSIVAADMLRLMLDEAPWMVLATFVLVAALMWLNFRSVKWAALALLPLVVGVLWMLLLMEVFGLQLNFYNIIVLPAVLGIGNDAGVHLVHRYREEGRGSILKVLRSTGEHVTMGSLTTMIGFGGLLLSFHPGLRSIGELAVTGIGATLLAALLFLPALLQWLEDRAALPPEGEKRPAAATNGEAARARNSQPAAAR